MTVPLPRQAVSSLVLRLLVLVAALGTVFLLFTSPGVADEPQGPTSRYVVDGGDTLWEIAASVAPPGSEVGVVVDQIIALNGLPDGTIYPGQALSIPVG